MELFKILIVVFAISGVAMAATKEIKSSSILEPRPSESNQKTSESKVVDTKPLSSALFSIDQLKPLNPILEPEVGEKLETSDSFGLGYYALPYAPLAHPVHPPPIHPPPVHHPVKYPMPLHYATYLDYYPGFYHSYRNHGFNGFHGYAHGHAQSHGHSGHSFQLGHANYGHGHGLGNFGYNYGVYH